MNREHTTWLAGLVWVAMAALAGFAWAQGSVDGVPPESARYPGGSATSKSSTINRHAFSQSSANMGFARELDFKIGNAIFRKLWVSAPASTKSSDGLGPLFNARSCQRCHLKDGRGAPPTQDGARQTQSLILQLSVDEAGAPDPIYGNQLQDLGIQGHTGEGRVSVRYVDVPVVLSDGTEVRLRKPMFSVVDLAYGPMAAKVRLSPRVAPQMIGMGLLEAIKEDDVLARADADDDDNDGVSGRANFAWSHSKQKKLIGRFGWKASMPTVLDQTAQAFFGDIGISSSLHPEGFGDCSTKQVKCRKAPHGGSAQAPEVSDKLLDLTAFYARNLAVPRRRDFGSPEVRKGKDLFASLGCEACHTPSYRTGNDVPDRHLRNQIIWPYTDLLLHDMGSGLADIQRDGQVLDTEWRTPPLWGIGLTKTVSGHTFFLHDGRARNLTEAILWHGGEAKASRDAFRQLSASERASLVKFVESL